MKKNVSLVVLIMFSGLHLLSQKLNCLSEIPEQRLNLNAFVGIDNPQLNDINSFSISHLVTLKEYKAFLLEMKRDSGEIYYKNLCPDSSITNAEKLEKYLTDTTFDQFPVQGVSWDNAMRFCRWKTSKEKGALVIFRLPLLSEWIAAKEHLAKMGIDSDFSKCLSEWTLNAFDESTSAYVNYSDESKQKDKNKSLFWDYDYFYWHSSQDPPVLKRKKVVGDSYRIHCNSYLKTNFVFYSYQGYRDVGFRYIRQEVSKGPLLKFNQKIVNKLILEKWKVQ